MQELQYSLYAFAKEHQPVFKKDADSNAKFYIDFLAWLKEINYSIYCNSKIVTELSEARNTHDLQEYTKYNTDKLKFEVIFQEDQLIFLTAH